MEQKKKILLVDDDEDIRSMYANIFRDNGFDTIERIDGVEGLEVATTEEGICLIFTGIVMPRMDGFEFTKALKEYANTVDIPVVVNSHLGREEDRVRMEELGVSDFLIRGLVSPAEIVRRVLRVINEKEYFVNIDGDKLDVQRFITEQLMPQDFLCDECGVGLIVKLRTTGKDFFRATVRCPECNKKFGTIAEAEEKEKEVVSEKQITLELE